MNGNFYDFVLAPFENLVLKKIRMDMVKSASGKTLEIGFGTGLNFPYYSQDIEFSGIEPDESMRKVAQKRADHYNFQISEGDAQALEAPDATFDTVVATLVFCTIPNPEKAIEEVWRVLKPGGKFLLFEHVRRNTPITGRFLDIATPFWKHVAGGCHLNRDPSKYLIKVGFKVVLVKTLWNGLGKVWELSKPQIMVQDSPKLSI
jgi:ubiquinone/menaquinone biosynthesis C-methylase UbiE